MNTTPFPSVYEAAEIIIKTNKAKIADLQDEISAAQVRLRTQRYANMSEAERLANDSEIFQVRPMQDWNEIAQRLKHPIRPTDESFADRVAKDENELNQLIAESTPIPFDQLPFHIFDTPLKTHHYGYHKVKDVVWEYDPARKKRYYYVVNPKSRTR